MLQTHIVRLQGHNFWKVNLLLDQWIHQQCGQTDTQTDTDIQLGIFVTEPLQYIQSKNLKTHTKTHKNKKVCKHTHTHTHTFVYQ